MRPPAIQRVFAQKQQAKKRRTPRSPSNERQSDSDAEESLGDGSSSSGPISPLTGELTAAPAAPPLLPPKDEGAATGYTVVLDMDETLLWHPAPGRVFRRPYLRFLLESLKGKCEVVLWTASTRPMGTLALDVIDPTGRYFDHTIFRSKAWFRDTAQASYVKDLERLGRDMSRVVIVENSPNSVRFHKEHAVLVEDYDCADDCDDPSLKVLTKVLLELLGSGADVPDFLAEHQRVQKVPVYRRGSRGQALTKKKPGMFYYINTLL